MKKLKLYELFTGEEGEQQKTKKKTPFLEDPLSDEILGGELEGTVKMDYDKSSNSILINGKPVPVTEKKVFKYLKHINEFFSFSKDKDKNYYSGLGKKYGLSYRKENENEIHLGPKNGHEINIKLGRSSCIVKPSYYGTFYKEEENVKDLEKYLDNYDFNYNPSKDNPDFKHKFSR